MRRLERLGGIRGPSARLRLGSLLQLFTSPTQAFRIEGRACRMGPPGEAPLALLTGGLSAGSPGRTLALHCSRGR